jgi:hypothetical protein
LSTFIHQNGTDKFALAETFGNSSERGGIVNFSEATPVGAGEAASSLDAGNCPGVSGAFGARLLVS